MFFPKKTKKKLPTRQRHGRPKMAASLQESQIFHIRHLSFTNSPCKVRIFCFQRFLTNQKNDFQELASWISSGILRSLDLKFLF